MNLEQMKQDTAKMIWKFSIPAIISMILTSLVTIADGFFIGNYVGKEGIAAVNLGLPIIYLYLGVGLMVSIGGVAIAGMALGAGDRDACEQAFRQTIVTTLVFSVLLGCIIACCFGPMLSILRAEGQVAAHFRDYYQIMLLELPVMVVNSSFGMFIRGEGRPEYYMKISLINVILNIFLDHVFACRLQMGVAGIGLASLLAAVVSLICILYFFMRKARVYRLGKFRFSREVCVHSLLNGSSEFIGEMSTGIAMFAYNFVIMRKIGADGVTAFTIVGYVAYLFSMVIVGFGQGSSPLVSFCYGAEEKALAADIRRRTSRYVSVAGVTVFLVMAGISDWYGGLFVASEHVRAMVGGGILIFMVSFFFSGVNSITSFYFTATGRAFESALISFSRGLVVLLACIFLLPAVFGMTGVWLAAPVTEAVTLGITGWCLWREGEGSLSREPDPEQIGSKNSFMKRKWGIFHL